MDIIQELKEKVGAGVVIPKPDAKADFIVKGWGIRRGEEALIYKIPNQNNASKPYQKGITVGEWRKAYAHIRGGDGFERDWFNRNMSECAKEGSCNFTTIGGIFQMLGLVDYGRGVYKSHEGLLKTRF